MTPVPPEASGSPKPLRLWPGVVQVLLLSGAGITSVAPGNGTVFWEHLWNGVTIVQPALIGDADVLISTCGGPPGGSAPGGLVWLIALKAGACRSAGPPPA